MEKKTNKFNFKDGDNFGHIIYNSTEKHERGYKKMKSGYHIYVKCSQKEMVGIIKKAGRHKIDMLMNSIDLKQKELIKLTTELSKFSINKFINRHNANKK